MKARAYVKRLMVDAGLQVNSRGRFLEGSSTTCLAMLRSRWGWRSTVCRLKFVPQVREDTMGNIYGRLPGSDPAAAAVATGSHTDAIPGAGAYDGTVGEADGWQG